MKKLVDSPLVYDVEDIACFYLEIITETAGEAIPNPLIF